MPSTVYLYVDDERRLFPYASDRIGNSKTSRKDADRCFATMVEKLNLPPPCALFRTVPDHSQRRWLLYAIYAMHMHARNSPSESLQQRVRVHRISVCLQLPPWWNANMYMCACTSGYACMHTSNIPPNNLYLQLVKYTLSWFGYKINTRVSGVLL